MTTNTENAISLRKLAAIIILASGGGWLAGNFIMGDEPLWNMLLHGISLPIVLILGLAILQGHKWANIGMNIYAVLSIMGLIVMIIIGASTSNPAAVGVKSTPDWLPVIVTLVGCLTWLTSLIPVRSRNARISTANNKY
ncbi:MAG TPA: hypothetical protein VKU38_07445 [Ktedonobacteraceae bacterium]|nr:hypothetical protein [Ktedonobacteraceae bacterium]